MKLSAIQAAGATIVYYPILRNLEPDLDALSRLAKLNPRVIYVIHYLGWPQPMKEIAALCRERGSILIEDCALSLLSEPNGTPLGASGDYSVFCLYKTLTRAEWRPVGAKPQLPGRAGGPETAALPANHGHRPQCRTGLGSPAVARGFHGRGLVRHQEGLWPDYCGRRMYGRYRSATSGGTLAT
jgi:hypothetical protein